MEEDYEEINIPTTNLFFNNKCPYPILSKTLAQHTYNMEEITDLMQISCGFQEKKSIQPENVLFAKNTLQKVENEKAIIKVEKEKLVNFIVAQQKHRIPQ